MLQSIALNMQETKFIALGILKVFFSVGIWKIHKYGLMILKNIHVEKELFNHTVICIVKSIAGRSCFC